MTAVMSLFGHADDRWGSFVPLIAQKGFVIKIGGARGARRYGTAWPELGTAWWLSAAGRVRPRRMSSDSSAHSGDRFVEGVGSVAVGYRKLVPGVEKSLRCPVETARAALPSCRPASDLGRFSGGEGAAAAAPSGPSWPT